MGVFGVVRAWDGMDAGSLGEVRMRHETPWMPVQRALSIVWPRFLLNTRCDLIHSQQVQTPDARWAQCIEEHGR